MLKFLLLPPILVFICSFLKIKNIRTVLFFISFLILVPVVTIFTLDKPYPIFDTYLIATKLNTYILLLSSIVSIGVTLSLITLDKHVTVTDNDYRRFYRFFAIFWIGLIVAILANNMGIFWIGLELATLSIVYLVKTNHTPQAKKQAWNYMIVGAIAISLILFGIILIYASAKPILGENAMDFDLLKLHAKEITSPFLFEIGFVIASIGMFVKMGFFPLSLWLADVERSAYYPVAALFSGVLESAIIVGFFNFSAIAMQINSEHIFIFVALYTTLTIFVVAFLIFRAKDFIRLFSFSGVEHMALIILFWVSGSPFAALLHFGAHSFLKPALFLSSGVLESNGKYNIAGALRGYKGIKGNLFWFLVSLFLLAIISLPPSPMFFSELYGFGAIINIALTKENPLFLIGFVLVQLILLSVIFYRFVHIYQSMKYEGVIHKKEVYTSELFSLVIFAIALLVLLLPQSITYIKSIA